MYPSQTAFNFTEKLSGFVTGYTFNSMGQSFAFSSDHSSCGGGSICVYDVSESLANCSQFSKFNISVWAVNVVARGNESEPFSIGKVLIDNHNRNNVLACILLCL